MEEYVWINGRADVADDSARVKPVLTRLAGSYGVRISFMGVKIGENRTRPIREAVARSASGIVIAYPVDPGMAAAIENAIDAGIRVVAVEGAVSSTRPIISVGADWHRMGMAMAARTAKLIGNTGDIVIAADSDISPRITAALNGFRSHVRRHPDIQIIDGDDGISPDDFRGRLVRAKHLAAIVTFGDRTSAAAIMTAGGEGSRRAVPIIASGSDLSLVERLMTGALHACYTPEIERSAAVAFALLRTQSDAGPIRGLDTGFAEVTAKNAQAFFRKIERWRQGGTREVDFPLGQLQESDPAPKESGDEERRSRAVLDAIPDLIFQIDRDGRFVRYKADRREDLYVPPERFLGKTADEVLPSSLATLTKSAVEKVLETGDVESYEYVLEIEGELRQYEARMAPTGPDNVIVIVRDITERNRSEEALRESEERFRVAFKTSPDAMAISRIEDGLFLDVNDGFLQITGYSRDELVGKTVFDLDIWVDHRDREKMTNALREHGFITNLEARFRLKGDRVHTGLQSARIIQLHGVGYILSVTRDIEEWKQAELALRESEERFRAVFETAQDAIYIKDRERRYVAVNASFARLPGLPASQFIGKKYEDIFGSVNSELNRRREEQVLGGDIVSEESIRVIDGRHRIFHIVMVPMRINGGEIIGLCGIAREITEMKRLQESAERAGRLEMAGTIAGQVAHDFNNLLGPLMAYPDIIRESLSQDSPVHQYLDDIERAAGQMADISQQLLTLGRRGHYTREIFSINEIIGYVLEHLTPPMPSITVDTVLADDLMNVSGGASQIYRVFSNLINNAYDAMPDGGRLLVRTENAYIDKAAGRYGRVPVGEYVKVTIADTGVGIPEDILAHIFDPFYTTKTTDRKRGSGLGLSVVHAVIEDHKGFVDVESTSGKGTTFYIYLPVTRKNSDAGDAVEVVGGAERILVVDDDRIQLDVVQTMLSRLGYTVRGAESSAEALGLLRERDYDLLLLDMVMPSGVDGAELYRRALDIRPDQPAIVMSGFAETERVKKALVLGAGQFLKKPLTLQALAAAVRTELDKRVRK